MTLILVLLAVLSFTGWLGGPYVAAQVIFFLIAGTAALLLVNLYIFWRTIKGKWNQRDPDQYREARDVTDKSGEDNIREGHIITESKDES